MRILNTANPIACARKTLREAIAADPGYKEVWIATLAMFMYDNLDDDRLKDRSFRAALSERLLALMFG